MKRSFFLLLFCVFFTTAFGQTVLISGTVKDNTGEALVGAGVVVKGTNQGVITDLDGKFQITVPNTAKVLVFSHMSTETKEVDVNNRTIIDQVLLASATTLDDVVVVGYGSMKKRDLTGAVSQIQGKDLKSIPVSNPVDALQGRTSGVMVVAASGTPGAASTVKIRGVGTVNNNNPLYVVDGLPQESIGWLNANDISSMEVLKDASATAIYGSRAANGVILITTQQGRSGNEFRTEINFDSYYGWQNPIAEYNLMNASEFIDYKNLAYINAQLDAAGNGIGTPFYTPTQKQEILNFLQQNTGSTEGTNWWKEIKNQNAVTQNYNISASGGLDKLSYHTSIGYMNQDGIINGSDYNRISWRTNLNTQMNKWLKINANFGIINERRHKVEEVSAYLNTIFNALAADPITPVRRVGLNNIPHYLENRFFMDHINPLNPLNDYSPILLSNMQNSVAQIETSKQSKWNDLGVKGGLSGEASIFPFLKYKGSIGVDLNRQMKSGFVPQYYLGPEQKKEENEVRREITQTNYFIYENTLTFDRTFNHHHILTMLGISAETYNSETTNAGKSGTFSNDKYMQVLDMATLDASATGNIINTSMASYFGRVFYSYKDKYMFTVNIRRDGTSKFSVGNRWGVFPSISTGWNFTEEQFMKDASWLSKGKLRLSWGEIGNQNVYYSAALSTYSGNTGSYIFGGNRNIAGGFSRIGNKNLTWETTRQTDIGIDLEFLNKKIHFTADYFTKTTDGMLLEVTLPEFLGFPNTPWVNAGSVKNTGWEFDVKYNGNIGADFTYAIGANLFAFKNTVQSLGDGVPITGGQFIDNMYTTRTEEGQSIGFFYGYKTNGIFQSQQEVDQYVYADGTAIQIGARPGDLRFVDVDGVNGITSSDRTNIGSPFPDFTYGFNFNFAYKGFDLFLGFQGSQGNKIMNIKKRSIGAGDGYLNAPSELMSQAWSPTNGSQKQFRISTDNAKNLELSDWYVEDGSYLRLKNIQLGYTLPNELLTKAKIKNIRLWVGAHNLFTITNYSGLDPEIGNSDPKSTGIDRGFYPQARTILFGINATF